MRSRNACTEIATLLTMLVTSVADSQRLAGFLADRPGQLVGAGLEGGSEALEQLDALLQRRRAQAGKASRAACTAASTWAASAPRPDQTTPWPTGSRDSRVSPWPASHWPAM